MRLRMITRTPDGKAKGMNRLLRVFLLGKGLKVLRHQVFINEDQNEILWDIECSYKDFLSITRKVAQKEIIAQGAMNHKLVRMVFKKWGSPEKKREVEELLKQTDIEIVKQAEADELVEAKTTWWESLKKKFKKVESDEEL